MTFVISTQVITKVKLGIKLVISSFQLMQWNSI